MKLTGEWLKLYNECLEILRAREGFLDIYLPFVERYVFACMQASRLAEEIQNEPLTVDYTNNKSKTNETTSPKVRVFAMLNREAIDLAKELGLSPAAAIRMKISRPRRVKALDVKMGINRSDFDLSPMQK